jgi:hypothetical protein
VAHATSAPAKNHHWPVRNQPSHDVHIYEELTEVEFVKGILCLAKFVVRDYKALL